MTIRYKNTLLAKARMEGRFMKVEKSEVLKKEKTKRNKVVQIKFTKASDAKDLEILIDEIQTHLGIKTKAEVSQIVVGFARSHFYIISKIVDAILETTDHN
jgi:translation initiation factor IF-3